MANKANRRTKVSKTMKTLSIDIGGTGTKAIILDAEGTPLTDRGRLPTPQPATPKAILGVIGQLAKGQGPFDRVSVGFPGVIRHGVVFTAPNLDPSWGEFNLVAGLTRLLKKPVRAANDADVQGFGAIKGRDIELVITLGTGFGSALFVNGKLVPNLEMGHHPFRSGKTKAIETLDRVLNFDHLYIGGGNSKKVMDPLPEKVSLVSNAAGLLGGIAFWNFEADDPMNRWVQAQTQGSRPPQNPKRGVARRKKSKR
jgi:polyphosphate glucokinase